MGAREPLFRRQAIAYRTRRGGMASPLLYHGRLAPWLGWAFAGVLMALVVLLITLEYRSTASAPGVLHGSAGLHRVVAPGAASIAGIHVSEGMLVRAGEVVATLSRQEHDPAGEPTRDSVSAHLEKQRELLLREFHLLAQQHQQARQRHERQLAGKQQQLQALDQEIGLLQSQLQLHGSNMTSLEKLLANRAIARVDYDRRLLEVLAGRRELSAARRLRQELELAVADLLAQQQHLTTEYAAARLEVDKQLAEVRHQLQQAERAGLTTLVAEHGGEVTAIALRVGDVVRANQTVLFIRRSVVSLSAEVWAPSRIAARLALGQPLMVRLDAFDFRHHGRIPAVVEGVSNTPLDPREYLLPVPSPDQALYRVEIRLQESPLLQSRPLPTGTTLVADFVLEEKSLMAYILEPVLRLRGKVV